MSETETALSLNDIFEKYELNPESLLSILHDIQNKFHYISEESIKNIAQKLEIPVNVVYSVVTFYNAFSLQPKGKYIVQVCMGTACHVRGAQKVLEELERRLGICAGETTENRLFSLETVNCLGACALGPIIAINGEFYGDMIASKVPELLKKYSDSKKAKK